MNLSTAARQTQPLGKQYSLPAWLLMLLLFVVMVFGVVAKSLYDSLVNNERVEFGWAFFMRTDILVAFLVSPMIFGAVYAYLRESPNNPAAFIFAFQNGFFWKTVFGRLEAGPTYQN